MTSQFVSDRRHGWTVCGPVFQELKTCISRYPHAKFHDYDIMVTEKFMTDTGKIIVLSQIGDLLELDKFREIFQENLEYYQRTGRKKNYFILLSAFEYTKEELKKYKDILTVFFIPSWYCQYSETLSVPESALNPDIKYWFLSYNGRSSLLRTSLFLYFYRKGLLDKSIFSYIGYSGYHPRTRFSMLIDRGADYYLNCHNIDPDRESPIDWQEVFKLIPYQIPNDTVTRGTPSITDIGPYNQTFCHLVAETYKGRHAPYFTEKIFKPIACQQPFIVFGSKHSLKFLRDIGFKTFEPWINESYDSMDQPDRFNAILAEIDRLAAMPLEQLKPMRKQMQFVLEHNRRHFYHGLAERYQRHIRQVEKELDRTIQDQLKYVHPESYG